MTMAMCPPESLSDQFVNRLNSAAVYSFSGSTHLLDMPMDSGTMLLEEDPVRSAGDLKTLLQDNGVDAGAAGPDNVFGYGKLQLPLIDSDGEGLNNVEEIALGTDALDTDSDDDGLTDYDEDRIWGTSPLLTDSDTDGLDDYEEVITYGTDPLTANTADLAPRGSPDGAIDVADYLILTRIVSGAIDPTGAEIAFGDLNNSGGLEAGDLVLMLRIVLGEIPPP